MKRRRLFERVRRFGDEVPHSKLCSFDLGGDAPQPDPQIGEAAKANAAIAGRVQDLAEKEYADQKALYDEWSPTLKRLIDSSVSAQDKATQQSDQQWADYNATWRPVEQKLASTALDWASPDRVSQEAQRAGTEASGEVDRAIAANSRSLAAAGASPQQIAAAEAAGRVTGAKTIGLARGQAVRDTEMKGLSLIDNAARFGRNMPSTGIATAQLAGSAGAQAGNQYGQLAASSAAPATTASSLYGSAVGANNAAGNLLLGDYNARLASYNANNALFGDVLGAGAGLLGMTKTAGGASGLAALGSFFSSKKIKRVVGGLEGAADAVLKSPVKRWRYKPGLGDLDQRERIGPMAEDLRDVTGGVVSDGHMVDGISLAGLHHAAIGEQERRLRRVEAALSDA